MHVTGFEPVHAPAWHEYVWLQRFEPVQTVPLLAFDHVVVEIDGAQAWHAFAGFVAFAAYNLPPMKQSATHDPEEHTTPLPQLAPIVTLDHDVVELEGVQTWHALDGFAVPAA